MKGTKRCSAARAYLHPVKGRQNLNILSHTTVDRVRFEDRRAVAVDVIVKGERLTLSARKEIILSAGALNSPQILLRSGVGPADQIAPHGLAVVHELPGVGQNLQDHIGVVSQFSCTQPRDAGPFRYALGHSLGRDQVFNWRWWRRLFSTDSGGAFIKSHPSKDLPDMQIHYVSVAMADVHGRAGVPPGHGFSSIVYACRPQSRGHVGLRDAHVDSAPALHPNYFSVEQDLVDTRNGFRETRRVFMQAAFDEFRGDQLKPPAQINVDSDDELDAWIRETGETLYHPVGTCKMGQDDMAVTDAQGQVHGLSGLRVVDASLMPTLIAGNTNAPTIMMAEKISDAILGLQALPPEMPA